MAEHGRTPWKSAQTKLFGLQGEPVEGQQACDMVRIMGGNLTRIGRFVDREGSNENVSGTLAGRNRGGCGGMCRMGCLFTIGRVSPTFIHIRFLVIPYPVSSPSAIFLGNVQENCQR